VSVVAGVGYRAIDRGVATLGCFHDQGDRQFLAYCASPQFGDYEHGAFYYALEPAAVSAMRHADVLFFGSSRAQFALSSDRLRQYFARKSIRHYLLGFSYFEQGRFPLALVRDYGLRPKVAIIASDPFFKNTSSGHIRLDAYQRWRAVLELYEYELKRAYIAAQPPICTLLEEMCVPKHAAIYRSIHDGAWTPRDLVPEGSDQPFTVAAKLTYTSAMATADLAFAAEFLRALGVAKECVVLTSPPSPAVNADAYVTEMGRQLGIRVVLPDRNGLTTFDGSHLSTASAERWSGDLLREVDTLITDCVSARPAAR
jgi:hypothetical protein